MRSLLFVLLIGCGSERAPDPLTPAPDKVPVARVEQLSPTQQLVADYAVFHKELRALVDSADALRVTVTNTRSDAERDIARKAHIALIIPSQVEPLGEQLAALVKRAHALPASDELKALLDDASVDDLLLKGVPSVLDEIEKNLRQDQATIDREAEQTKLREDAKAKLEKLVREKAELDRKVKEAKDAAAKKKRR